MKLELYYPCSPYYVNQAFGVNGAYYQSHGINIKGHNGIDLHADHGELVYAAHDGIAYFETDADQGEGVVLVTNQSYDYKGQQVFFKTIYWHLCDYVKEPQFKCPVLDYQQNNGAKGMPVKRGDIIGYADNTGLSTGNHLHFGLKPIATGGASTDPTQVDSTDVGIGNWRNIEQSNGYAGAIDPTPYFNGKYAYEVVPLTPADSVAVIAATEEAKGNKTLSDELWAIVAVIRAFLKGGDN